MNHFESATAHDTESTSQSTISEQRVSVIIGDRLCANCYYNLTGQPVLREPHYQMLIVRCPECATVVSVQEYPLLGKWSQRWAAMVAALWLLLLVALLLGMTGALFGSSFGAAQEISDPYGTQLMEKYSAWHIGKVPNAQQQNVWWWSQVKFDEFWEQKTPTEWFISSGGWRGAIDPDQLPMVLIPMGIAFIFGCIWSICMLHRRRMALLVSLIGYGVLATGLYATIYYITTSNDPVHTRDVQMDYVTLPIVGVLLAVSWLVLGAGLMVGRPVVRSLIRALLPPRLRGPLVTLWIADGKSLPGTVHTR